MRSRYDEAVFIYADLPDCSLGVCLPQNILHALGTFEIPKAPK